MLKLKHIALAFAVAMTLTVFTSTACADNIVRNPGFEEGSDYWFTPGFGVMSFDGWNYSHSGNASAGTGCVSHGCMDLYEGAYLQQLLNTQPGQTYTLTFWVAENGGATSEMAVYWGGNLIADVLNPANNTCGYSEDSYCNFVQFTFTGLLAASESTLLQINGRQDPAGIYFDDFSVSSGSTATPEPASLALIGSGLLGMIVAFRRHRNA